MIGIVTGLAAEARLAARLGRVVPGGGTVPGAETAASTLIGAGVRALLSFGLAGGLDPSLRPGEVLVPATVTAGSRAFPTDAALRRQLGPGRADPMTEAPVVVADAAAKARLRSATGACAVDMESGAVARVAARHGLPFAVLRVICDPAERTLPPAALVALDHHGAIGLVRVFASLAAAPGQIPALLALAADARLARAALVRRVRDIRVGGGLMA